MMRFLNRTLTTLIYFGYSFSQNTQLKQDDYKQMLINQIKSRQITTWRTKTCLSFFPYGSSPWPPITTFLFTEIPSVLLTVYLFIQGHLPLAAFLIIIQIAIMLAMIKVLSTNPGILPQIVYKWQTDEQLFQIPSRSARQEHKYIITQRNLLHHQKYCGQCHIYRPIRSIHCSSCNHCVQRYDHHCPWLAICIGKYNYKYFLVYLVSLNVLIITSLAIGLAFTIQISKRQDSMVGDFVVYMVICLLAFILVFPMLRLLIYHFQLINKGITTNEEIKKTFKLINNELPFERLEYSIYRQKRLPKLSFRRQKRPETFSTEEEEIRQSKSYQLQKLNKVSIFNSLIENQHL